MDWDFEGCWDGGGGVQVLQVVASAGNESSSQQRRSQASPLFSEEETGGVGAHEGAWLDPRLLLLLRLFYPLESQHWPAT